jgi:phytoene synthase
LFGIDDAMADVVVRATQPALAAVKLAWWRERLEQLDQGKVPAEPRLQDAARELLPLGITGHSLAQLEEGWAALLQEAPDLELVRERGAVLFGLGARLLKADLDDQTVRSAGHLFAVADGRRRRLPAVAIQVAAILKAPRKIRPLTALAALAARDLRRKGTPEAEATPGRAWTLLRHRLTGRI